MTRILFAIAMLLPYALLSLCNSYAQETLAHDMLVNAEMEKETYFVGELILIKVSLRNISTTTLSTEEPYLQYLGKGTRLFCNGKEITKPDPGCILLSALPPGASVCRVSDIFKTYHTSAIERYYYFLSPGDYELLIRVHYQSSNLGDYRFTPDVKLNFRILDHPLKESFFSAVKTILKNRDARPVPENSESSDTFGIPMAYQKSLEAFHLLLLHRRLRNRNVSDDHNPYYSFITENNQNYFGCRLIFEGLEDHLIRIGHRYTGLKDTVKSQYFREFADSNRGTILADYLECEIMYIKSLIKSLEAPRNKDLKKH